MQDTTLYSATLDRRERIQIGVIGAGSGPDQGLGERGKRGCMWGGRVPWCWAQGQHSCCLSCWVLASARARVGFRGTVDVAQLTKELIISLPDDQSILPTSTFSHFSTFIEKTRPESCYTCCNPQSLTAMCTSVCYLLANSWHPEEHDTAMSDWYWET